MERSVAAWSRAVIVGLAGAAVALVCSSDASAVPPPAGLPAGGNAASNQAQFNATFAQISGKYGTQRDVSPTKNVFPAGTQNNGAHVPNYGLRGDYLTGAGPNAHGGAVSTTIDGLTAANVGTPPPVELMRQKPIAGKSKRFHNPKAIQLAKLEKSAQNIWSAQETLAHVKGSGACSGKTGNDLVNCAKGYMRDLGAPPPQVGSSCERFVYNRYYDIERWTDRANACGRDNMCKAAVTLDKSDGIAGKLLSGSDGDPGKRQALQNLLDLDANLAMGAGNKNSLPDCTKHGLHGQELTYCEAANSLPPIAHIRPTYSAPIAGGGAPESWNCNGSMVSSGSQGCFALAQGSSSMPWGYLLSKNSFFGAVGSITAAQMFTPTLVASFSKDPAKYQSVQRLVAELNRGQAYYFVGKQPPTQQGVVRFPDEWDFQRHMLDATKGTSERTFRDYAKRKAFVTQRAQAFAALFTNLVNPAPKFAIPANLVAQVRGASPGGVLGRLASGNDVYSNPVDYTQGLTGAVPNGMDSSRSPWWLNLHVQQPTPTTVDTFAWNGGASLPPIDTRYNYPRLLCTAPDKYQPGYSATVTPIPNGPGGMPVPLPMTPINGPALNGTMPVPSRSSPSDVTTAACNYVNAVLDEWARKDMPQVLAPSDKTPPPAPSGCFANDPACDWDPNDFVAGISDLVHTQIRNVESPRQEADYKFCREWVAASGVASGDSEFQVLAKMKAKLQGSYNQISNVPVIDRGPYKHQVPWARNAKRPEHDHFGTFGEERTNAETWGNELFGVGYSFNAGWEIPLEWEKVDDKLNYDVCNVGAGAHAGFEAYAYAFGSDKFDILDADLASGINDYEDIAVPGVSNQAQLNDNMHHTAFDLDFTVAGDSLFDQDVRLPSNGYSQQPAQGSNSWILFEIPFQITFITLDISVGIGYQYALNASVSPIDRPDVCHGGDKPPPPKGWPKPASQPQIGLSASVTPSGALDGIIDASASIAGLVGIGVECDITLLGIGIPATATASITPSGLSLDTSLNMTLNTLSGSLSVYAEALFFKIFDITIISWDGMTSTVPLFNTKTTAAFPNLDPIGATGLQNPARSLVGL